MLSRMTSRFHCHKCFEKLLPQISHGLGIGLEWMRHVELILDLKGEMTYGQQLTIETARAMARETMRICQRKAWAFWGRLDLMEKERWKYEPLKGETIDPNTMLLHNQMPVTIGPPHWTAPVTFPPFQTHGQHHPLQTQLPNPQLHPTGHNIPPPAIFPLPALMNGMHLANGQHAQVPTRWLISGFFDL
jgi:hypothetical protein